MCGIAGIYNFNSKPVDRQSIFGMAGTLSHRGPDDNGYLFCNTKTDVAKLIKEDAESEGGNYDLGIAHNRLSIIDLSKNAGQPMSNEDQMVWLAYNGEIYNFAELRGELAQKGHIFKSKTDSEVVIHAYEEYSFDCLNRLNGMWAFALWDVKKRILFCARDRFGEKPFYYYCDADRFIFASEAKAFLKIRDIDMSPDNRTIYRYLAYGIGFANTDKSTFFKNIYQLEPARFIVVKNGALAFKTYWDFDFSRKNELSQAETFERFAGLFEDSVKLRLRSDVPVGFYLSGGLDSSSVTSVAHSLLADQQITAFSTRYEEPGFDEHKYAAEVADFNNIDIVYVSPKPEELFENISKIVWHLDEPFQHLNIYAQWCIMREADKRGIKVMLTGHGGDEMLHSYPRQHMYYFSDLFLRLKWRRLMKEISFYSRIAGHSRTKLLSNAVRLALTLSLPLKIPYIGYRFLPQALDCLDKDFRRRYAHDFYFPDRGIKGVMNKSYQLEYRLSPVPIWLRCEDRVSMAFSVESRSPFFDHRLVEFCVALESGYKIKNGVSKYILRQSLSNKLPHKVLARSDKKGFTAPSEIWMKNELKGRITEIFSSPEFKRRGYLDQSAVLKEFNLHCKGQKNLRAAIWSWVNLELWFKEFFKK